VQQYQGAFIGFESSPKTGLSVGCGPKKSIASNAAKEGKQKTRRVEVVIETTMKK
jgi:outer membrane protein OmpA-like peptidoglycan-associated protein